MLEMTKTQQTEAENLLKAVNGALDQIDLGTFGRCRDCSREIEIEQLEAIPWVPYCVACQERIRRGTMITEKIERCPYCLVGDEFRLMIQRSEGWFMCTKCGHTAMPDQAEFKCFCKKCGELNRAA